MSWREYLRGCSVGREDERARIRRDLEALARSWRDMPGTLEGEGYRFAMASRLEDALKRICPQDDGQATGTRTASVERKPEPKKVYKFDFDIRCPAAEGGLGPQIMKFTWQGIIDYDGTMMLPTINLDRPCIVRIGISSAPELVFSRDPE